MTHFTRSFLVLFDRSAATLIPAQGQKDPACASELGSENRMCGTLTAARTTGCISRGEERDDLVQDCVSAPSLGIAISQGNDAMPFI
jgi:hypothetical protein